MNKQRKTSHILNVFQYDADGHVILPASLTLSIAPTGEDNSGKVPTTAWVRSIVGGTVTAYTPTSRTITINGTSYDLSSNRAWSIDTGVMTATAGSGISVSTVSGNLNIVNTGLLTATAGAGISVSTVSQNLNIVNTGLLTATAGSGITVSVVGQNLNVVNTGILTATAGSGISLSVVGQNLNVVNTGILTATAGAGISVSVVNGNLNVVNTITNNNQLTNGAGFITGYTETDTLATVTGRGATTSTVVTFSGGDGNNSSVKLAGYNQRGGSGYHGFLETTNTFGSATNASKYFRLDSVGTLQIVNNAYTATILSLTDAGALSVPSLVTAGSFVRSGGTSTQFLKADGSVDSSTYATQTYVTTQISNLVNSAPATLDTLNELAAALGNDANFSTTVTNSIATRVPQTRTLTINGTAYDLSADRSWTITAGVSSVNAGTGVSVNSTTGAVTVSIGQSVATSAQVTFDSVITNNNGNGTNFRIGDDVWIGDINAANTFRIQGVQNAANAYIVFGNGDTTALGRASTGALTYGGNTVYHAGNLTNLNQLTNGPGYITSYTETDPFRVTTVSVTGTSTKTITLTRADNSTVSTTWTDIDTDTNTFASSLGFSGGTLTLTNNNSSTVTVSLDGRYYLASNPNSYITSSSNISGSSASAPILTASGSLTTQYGNGTIGYSYALTNPQTGLFSAVDNSNAIITINRHPDNYYSQLGFSSNGNLYYRSFSAAAINTSQGWQTIWTSNSLTNLNQLSNGPGYITGESDTLATVTSRGNTTTGSINVNGNILMTGTATTTNQARTIDFTGFDKEGVTDFSDRAYIQHTTNTGGHTGSVLVIASENDAEDGIAFLTNASSKLKHNSNNIATESFVTSQGYVTGGPYLPLIGGSISGTLTTNGQLAVANNIVMYGDNKQIQWNAAASADLFISAIPGTRTIEIRNGNAASPNYAACGLITGYATFTSNVTVQGNITVSSSNTTGGGIILADDGDIVDLNDAYCSMRFSYGVRIYSANRGGSPVITLANTGVVTATTFSGALSGNATTASSISGFNNPTTAATANTIVYRDGSGDVAAREFVLTASTIHVDTPSSMLGIYPTTNQVVKFGSPAARNFLNVPTRTGGDASGTWGISISGNAATATYSSLDFRHSDRDFPNGTLVQTNINYAVSSGDAFVLEIRGNSYFNTIPFDVQIQGYIYNDTIISTGGYSNGKYIDGIRAINHNGNLCFWWPSGGYWEGFNVKVYSAFASYPSNRVTSITNSSQPTTAKQVNFSPVQSLHSGNFNSYAPSLTGGNASGTWGINITGNAATATSATDSTKLPLAGGTLTGNLLFSNSGTTKRGIQGVCGDNDFWFIGGGATASNSGFLEIATGDDGQSAGAAEPIYVSQYGPGDVLTGTLFRRASLLDANGNTSFPGSLSIAGNTALHAGNYTSYTLPRGGGWYGVNVPGSRWGGFSTSGGEIVFGDGLPNAGQMGILVDGAYLAGENNGFWSLPSDNNWNGRRGMFWDGTNLNFTTNSPRASFTSITTTAGSGGSSGNSTVIGLKIAGLNNYDSLELGTEDNYNAVIRTYGNDLKYYAGHWRSGVSSEDHSHLWYTSRNGSSDWSTVKMSLNHLGNLSVSGTVSSNGATLGCGVGTGRGSYGIGTLNLVLLSSSTGSDGVSGIDFRSGNNYPSDGASIYYENSQTGSGEVSRLVLRVENDLNDSILIRAGYHVYNARTVDMASQGADNPVFRWQYLDSNRMTLDSSGNLVCNGDVTAYSDARIKTNIHTIENALDKTLRMRGVTYNRTDVNDASNKVGVIAQEVMEILPEVVHEQSDGMLGVSYGNIVGVLIEAIKEQQKQIENLTNKINLLTQNK